VFSFSRSSFLSLAVALCLLLLLERRRVRVGRWVTIASLGAGGAVLLSWLFAPALLEVSVMRLWLTVTGLFANPNVWLSGRLTSWGSLVDYMIDNPVKLLVGTGYGTLPYREFVSGPLLGDNMYLSVLVETGVLGLAAMLVLNLAVLRTALLASRNSDWAVSVVGTCVFCFWVGQLFQMLSVDVLTFWRVLPLYMALLGMAAQRTLTLRREAGLR